MTTFLILLAVADILLALVLFVVHMERLDRRYAAAVRAEYARKSILRGETTRHDQRT